MARGALSALGHDDRRESLLLDAESMQAEARSNHGAAKSLREEALRLAVRAADGRRDASVARAHGNLGQLLASMGEDPRSEINQALAIYRELGGDDHPELAPGLEALAIYASSRAAGKPGAPCDAACRGYRKEAEDRFREALEIRRQAFGEIHGDVAASHNNLSYLFFQTHDYDRSVAEIRASLAIYEQLEPDGPKVAETVVSLGEVLDEAGQPKQALAAYQRALALREKQLGPEHREVAAALSLVGRRNRRDGKFEEALSAFRRALRIYEQVDGKQAETANETRQEIAYAEHRDTRAHAKP
jgi:serine/threonine-protein kinase